MRHSGALRNFASTLRALAERDHRIHLVFHQRDKEGDERLLEELLRTYPGITCGEPRAKAPWRFWLGLGRAVRYSVDYLRYLTPDYEGITSLTERARSKPPALMRSFVEWPVWRTPRGHRFLTRALLAVERAVPIDRAVFDLVRRDRPDLVLVTPLVDIGSDQVDYVKAARRLGIRSALPVLSWDNLTNKGLVRVQPDKVFVWNEAQKAEAEALHGVAAGNVVVTGAMVYDQWFARRPSSTREAFCERVGLDTSKPFFLYLCSSPFIAPDEVSFIEQWITAVRSAPDPRVRHAGLLIRPHPENLQPWQRFSEMRRENVAVWPPRGASPVDFESRNDFFDSMYHAEGAVGINTSAQIECGIIGRPVFSIRTPAYRRTQDGTLHFRHLLNEGGGLLELADDFDAHVRQLAAALEDPAGTQRRLAQFVRAFTRPHGLDVEATPRMIAGLEALYAAPAPEPEGLPLTAYPLRAVLYPVAVVMAIVRRMTRVSRKRQRQLRPVTMTGTIVHGVLTFFDRLFLIRPVRNFVKRRIVPRAVSRLSAIDAPAEEAVAVAGLLERMAERRQPVIVGPWVSEVGFELLYWIPFLNWVNANVDFDRSRLIVVSRGGVASWYTDLSSQYVDLFDYFTPAEFAQRGGQQRTSGRSKPRTITEFDRDILKLVKQTRHLQEIDLLHPMHMYRLFQSFWDGRASSIDACASFKALPSIDTSDVGAKLPDDYVAVRFHFNDAFPDTDANRRLAASLVDTLAETADVVLLTPSTPIDDRLDVDIAVRKRVHRIGHLMTPRTNLEVQSKVIARARAFVGTHGGLSYLPPLYGVPSVSFYSAPAAFPPQHLELARRVFTAMNPGSVVALHPRDPEALGSTLGGRHEALAGLARRRLF